MENYGQIQGDLHPRDWAIFNSVTQITSGTFLLAATLGVAVPPAAAFMFGGALLSMGINGGLYILSTTDQTFEIGQYINKEIVGSLVGIVTGGTTAFIHPGFVSSIASGALGCVTHNTLDSIVSHETLPTLQEVANVSSIGALAGGMGSVIGCASFVTSEQLASHFISDINENTQAICAGINGVISNAASAGTSKIIHNRLCGSPLSEGIDVAVSVRATVGAIMIMENNVIDPSIVAGRTHHNTLDAHHQTTLGEESQPLLDKAQHTKKNKESINISTQSYTGVFGFFSKRWNNLCKLLCFFFQKFQGPTTMESKQQFSI